MPRYTNKHLFKYKNIYKFIVSLRRHFGHFHNVDQVGKLKEEFGKHEVGVYLYTGLGDTASILEFTNLAVVCGSFCNGTFAKAKGHNIYEPLAYNIPTITGPNHANWKHSLEELKAVLDKDCISVLHYNEVARAINNLVSSRLDYEYASGKLASSDLLQFHRATSSRIASIIWSEIRLSPESSQIF